MSVATGLYALIPAKLQPYAKTVLAVLGAVATAVVPLLPNVPDWLALILAALTALGVYTAPNKPNT